jgi:hypothetical protein
VCWGLGKGSAILYCVVGVGKGSVMLLCLVGFGKGQRNFILCDEGCERAA